MKRTFLTLLIISSISSPLALASEKASMKESIYVEHLESKHVAVNNNKQKQSKGGSDFIQSISDFFAGKPVVIMTYKF